MTNKKTTQTLNRLIEVNNDRIEGYESASVKTQEDDLKNIFFQFIQTSKKCNVELISEVLQLGGKPEKGCKIIDKFFKIWSRLKSELICKNRRAVLTLCKYIEDKSTDIYDHVLRNNLDDLNGDQQKLVWTQRILLKKDYYAISALRDKLLISSASLTH